MRLNIDHEEKTGNPYNQGRAYTLLLTLVCQWLTGRYKGKQKSKLYEVVIHVYPLNMHLQSRQHFH